MRRRDFITLLGGAVAAWPVAARAQQQGMPVIGFMSSRSPAEAGADLAAFRQGLGQAGYFEGKDVTIEYCWAEGQNDRLPAMAADLVRRNVAVIAATSAAAAVAAKAATTIIPIVFETGVDPVALGFVASLNRPGGNVTGVTHTNLSITPKWLELLHEFIPNAKTMALLVNPADPIVAEPTAKVARAAARTLGLELHVLNASSEADFDGVFAKLTQLRADGLVIGGGSFFLGRQKQLGELSLHHAMPAVSETRDFAVAGGLMSYGADVRDAYRLAGIYAGRFSRVTNPLTCQFSRSLKSSSTST